MGFEIHDKEITAKKLKDRIEFPEILDFKSWKHLIFENDQERVLIDSEYELYAVLVHSGPQLGYGHYYALIKSSDGYLFRMNDMDVIPVNTKHVLREQGYMVFYKRKTDNLMKCHLRQIKAQHKQNGSVKTDEEEEQKEAQDKQIIDGDKSVKNEKIKNGIKVDTDLLTTDYFANNCDAPRDIVMVDQMKKEPEDVMLDKKSYVNVPPMATRPELNNNNSKNGDGHDDAVEVFWPVKQME